jgi:hypothetical protein
MSEPRPKRKKVLTRASYLRQLEYRRELSARHREEREARKPVVPPVPLTDEERELVGSHFPLAMSIAGDLCRMWPWASKQEIVSAAGEALCLLVQRWEREAPFEAFVKAGLKFGVRTLLQRVYGKGGNSPRSRECRATDSSYKLDLRDHSPPVGWEMESEDAVDGLLGAAVVSPEGRERVRRLFLDASCGGQQTIVADRLGVARNAVYQDFHRVRHSLRALFAKGGDS